MLTSQWFSPVGQGPWESLMKDLHPLPRKYPCAPLPAKCTQRYSKSAYHVGLCLGPQGERTPCEKPSAKAPRIPQMASSSQFPPDQIPCSPPSSLPGISLILSNPCVFVQGPHPQMGKTGSLMVSAYVVQVGVPESGLTGVDKDVDSSSTPRASGPWPPEPPFHWHNGARLQSRSSASLSGLQSGASCGSFSGVSVSGKGPFVSFESLTPGLFPSAWAALHRFLFLFLIQIGKIGNSPK